MERNPDSGTRVLPDGHEDEGSPKRSSRRPGGRPSAEFTRSAESDHRLGDPVAHDHLLEQPGALRHSGGDRCEGVGQGQAGDAGARREAPRRGGLRRHSDLREDERVQGHFGAEVSWEGGWRCLEDQCLQLPGIGERPVADGADRGGTMRSAVVPRSASSAALPRIVTSLAEPRVAWEHAVGVDLSRLRQW